MVRLSWDKYFLQIAHAVSSRSPCLSVKRGIVLVKDKIILSTGYNGPPMGVRHCEVRDDKGRFSCNQIFICPRKRMGFKSGGGLEFCIASHAEGNAIVLAARKGISTEGAILYCNFNQIPCRECAKYIINAGIKRIVLNGLPAVYPEKGITGKELLEEAGIVIDGQALEKSIIDTDNEKT